MLAWLTMEDLFPDLLEGQESTDPAVGDDFSAQPAVEKDRENCILDGPGPLAVVPVEAAN